MCGKAANCDQLERADSEQLRKLPRCMLWNYLDSRDEGGGGGGA